MKNLTFEQKVELLDGKDVWNTKAIGDLPAITMADGPHGIRKQIDISDNLGLAGSLLATAFPTASLLACSWDRDLISLVAKKIADEAKAYQINIVLGPGINIKRSPLCGRNFEYFSEDPYLTGELASYYVRSMEDSGVGTSVKHFCCNNQEKYRFTQDSIVDNRALNEIYLPAFYKCVQENPTSLMASYNKLNGYYNTESPFIHDILRKQWGYQGLLITDWGASNDRILGVKNGCDLEMPTSSGYNTQKLLQASVKDHKLKLAIETSAERIIKTVERLQDTSKTEYSIDEHHQIAKTAASESMVLLKNESILPLSPNDKVAIVGGFIDEPRYQGGGSSHINPHKLEAIKDVYQEYGDIFLTKGYHLDGKDDADLVNEAIDIAKKVDKIVFIAGLPDTYETEGVDRKNIDLPVNQKKLLYKLASFNNNIVVCVVSGSVVNLRFADEVKAILMCYLAGQANSSAMLDILYGRVNPSGRLAETFIDDITNCNVQLDDSNNVYYQESIYVGYRYYNTFEIPVRYPFGYGLSYTDFEYRDLIVSSNIISDNIEVRVKIKNIGNLVGKEVVQLYIENNQSSVYKPKRELKQFTKVVLNPNQEKEIIFYLNKDSFSYYDVNIKRFNVNSGDYKIQICKSVEEVILEEIITCHDNEEDYKDHLQTSYNQRPYDVSDFQDIYQQLLPPQRIVRKRPYNLSSTLEDIKKSFIGKIIVRIIIKQAMKVSSGMTEEWMVNMMKETIYQTPIRGLAVMSGGVLTLEAAEGIVDLVNFKIFKGIIKIRRGLKR